MTTPAATATAEQETYFFKHYERRVEVEEEYERCEECGHTPETGACYACRMD